MGGLIFFLPLSYISILIGSICIMGFPFLTGFYSKDFILEFAFSRYFIDSLFIYFFGLFAAICTALYSSRLLILVFILKNNNIKNVILNECNSNIFFSIFILSFFSIFVGFVFSDLFVGYGTFFWSDSLFFIDLDLSFLDVVFLHPLIKNLPVIFSLFGFIFGVIVYWILEFFYSFIFFDKWFCILYGLLCKISIFFFFSGFFNYFYNIFFYNIFMMSYNVNTKIIDKGFLEFLGPFGIYKLFRFLHICSLEYIPFVIFFSICFMFISLCFIVLFFYLYFELFLFFLFNKGLVFILIFVFFFEWYYTKIKI